jgi:hypothetical protein
MWQALPGYSPGGEKMKSKLIAAILRLFYKRHAPPWAFNALVRITAVLLLLTLCALPVAIAPRDVRAGYGDCLVYDSYTNNEDHSETTGPSSEVCPELEWTGSTWSWSSEKVNNTPTTTGESLTDGGVETWTTSTNLTNWSESISGTSTINQESSDIYSGSYAARFDIDSSNSNTYLSQSFSLSTGTWIQYSAYIKASTGGKSVKAFSSSTTIQLTSFSPTTSYVQYLWTGRTTGSTSTLGIQRQSAASSSIYLDALSVKTITLNTLSRTVNVNRTNLDAQVILPNFTTLTQAGIIIGLDSASSPNNFILATLDGGGKAWVNQNLNGTYSTLVAAGTVTYGAAKVLRVTRDGTTINLYYDGNLIGTGSCDAGINGTLVGTFSTYSGNTFDNFFVTDLTANTPTNTPTNTFTATNTSTPSDTPTHTGTFTFTPTDTGTFTPTRTATHTGTFTHTPTDTYTPTTSNTPTDTSTPTNTFTPTNTSTPHYDATTTYQAAYAYYTGIAEENYPTIIILSVLCGIILLALIVWAVFAYLRKRR